jgi:4-hydroxybenzoate polyprenyltransferase
MRELVKDLENIQGDLTHNYRTIPVLYGEAASKKMLTVLGVLTLVPGFLLVTKFDIGYMDLFFYGSTLALFFFMLIIWNASKKIHYIILHNILKLIIVIGVFSIILIDIDLLINRLF